MLRTVVSLALALPIAAFAGASPGWSPASLAGADVRSLAFDPTDPDTVIAGTASGQLYRSKDAGVSWETPGSVVAFPGWVITDLEFDPDRPSRLWLGARGVFGGGMVALSDDRGASWEVRRRGLEGGQVYSLAVVPGREGDLYAGTRDGVYGTRDGGGSWRRLTAEHPELQKVTSLAVDPTDPQTVVAGTWRRAYRSLDGGNTWTGVFEGMILDTEVFQLEPVPGRAGELWASTCGWVYRGERFGNSWTRYK